MNTKDLGYKDTPEKLKVRIEAHKNFSNFSLEDWIENNLEISAGHRVLDLGCGSGNLFPVISDMVSPQGVVLGMDKDFSLLKKARKVNNVRSKILCINSDMNGQIPILSQSIDVLMAMFSIYYADSARNVLSEVNRLLKKSGKFYFIGPAGSNAEELLDFNECLFGFKMDQKGQARTKRLESEFLPIAQELFKSVKMKRIKRKLVFPNKSKFIDYYMATLLFEESMQRTGKRIDWQQLIALDVNSLELSKERVLVTGKV